MVVSNDERFESTLTKVRKEMGDHLREMGLMPGAIDRIMQVRTMLESLKTLFA
jgi:hypothetical protein